MPSQLVHAVYTRTAFGSQGERTICYWRKLPRKYTLKVTDQIFLITDQESWDLQRRFIEGPVDFRLIHVVSRPGGSVYRPEYAVEFFHRPSAMLFKLTRS